MASLYCGAPDVPLDRLRLYNFSQKSKTSTKFVEPETIPPTEKSVKHHSLRVYQQIQVWLGNDERVPPCQWGWREHDGKLIPLMTDKLGSTTLLS